MKKPNIYSIYDSHDNDTLVYSGGLEGAAHFLNIQKKSVCGRSKVPFLEQKSRYRIILEGYEESLENDDLERLQEEIERLNEEIGILRTCYLNELTAEKTPSEIKKYIMNLRMYEVREIYKWMKNIIVGEEEE